MKRRSPQSVRRRWWFAAATGVCVGWVVVSWMVGGKRHYETPSHLTRSASTTGLVAPLSTSATAQANLHVTPMPPAPPPLVARSLAEIAALAADPKTHDRRTLHAAWTAATDVRVRIEALHGLAELGGLEAATVLEAALGDVDARVHVAAIEGLLLLRDDLARASLERATYHSDAAVRSMASDALELLAE
jgi:hypothetical protein